MERKVPLWALLVTAVVAATCMIGWTVAWYPEVRRWGDVASWVSALSSVGALIAAIWAASIARGLYEREAVRDARVIHNDETAQAAKVAGWVEIFENGTPVCRLRNASDIPVTRVHVEITVQGAWTDGRPGRLLPGKSKADLVHLPPNSRLDRIGTSVGVLNRGILAPTDDYIEVEIPWSQRQQWASLPPFDGSHPSPWPLTCVVRFTDAAGREWQRDTNGLLGSPDESHTPLHWDFDFPKGGTAPLDTR